MTNVNEFEATLKAKKGAILTFEADTDVNIPTWLQDEATGLYRANISILDPRGITLAQRGYIFGRCKDIANYTGYPPEIVRDFMKGEYCTTERPELETFSLGVNQISQLEASNFIEFIIEWCFKNEVPFTHQQYFIGKEHTRTLFLYLKYRKCFISGDKGDVAHYKPVGMGRNRDKIDHSELSFMCLRRDYHDEQHTIGLTEFCKKYKIVPITLTPRQVKEFGIGKEIEKQYKYEKQLKEL